MNTVSRFECSMRYARTAIHDSGPGKPTRKRSQCCGADWRIEHGLYGLFVHSSVSGSATYRSNEALSLHRTERQANEAADTNEQFGLHQLAVRFVTV